MASGDFDMGLVKASVGGTDVSGELMSVNFGNLSGQEPSPVFAGGARALSHRKQSKANHRIVTVRIAYPSSVSGFLNRLSAEQTDTTFSYDIGAGNVASIPDGETTAFSSARVVVMRDEMDYSDNPGERVYRLSCIGFREELKGQSPIERLAPSSTSSQ